MTIDPGFWDRLAEDYAAKPVDDPESFDRKTAITTTHLTSDSVVLDVGCGTGSFVLRLAPHAHHVHGVDISGEMLRIARTKAEGVDNVTFHQGTLADVPLEGASLQGVCAYSILHLVDDLPGTLAAVYDLLEPGGFFISSTVVLGGSWIPYRPLLAVMRWLGKAPDVQIFGQEDLSRAIEQAGFVGLTTPDVGASSTVAFVVAYKPA